MIAHGGNVALVPGHRIRNHRPLEGIDLFGKRRHFRRHLPEQVEAGAVHAEHEAVGDVPQLPDIARPRPSLVQHPFCKFSAYGFAPMGRL